MWIAGLYGKLYCYWADQYQYDIVIGPTNINILYCRDRQYQYNIVIEPTITI